MTVRVSGLGSFQGVCIREKGPGVSGMTLAISTYQNNGGPDLEGGITGMMEYKFLSFGLHNKDWVNSSCPNKSEAVDIAGILARDWDFFELCFDEAGGGQLRKGWNYWTEEWDWKAVYDRRWAMVLSVPNNDGLEWFDVNFSHSRKRTLFRSTFYGNEKNNLHHRWDLPGQGCATEDSGYK